MVKGASGSTVGGGTWATMRSNKGAMSTRGSSRSSTAQPSLAEANRVGKSSCSSVASRAANRSKIMSCTSCGRASVRSTLLISTIGLRPRRSALPVTNLVCGSGPSAASTSTTTPSTIDRMRSTSPPKSAWPGVSTMLRRTSFHTTEVHLARIVMPRSRSRSFESIARSATCWLGRKVPLWASSLSTRVVLPWSTCAMIARLRRSMKRRAGRRLAFHQCGMALGRKLGERDLRPCTDMGNHLGGGEAAERGAAFHVTAAAQPVEEAGGVEIAGAGGVDQLVDRLGPHRDARIAGEHDRALLAARERRDLALAADLGGGLVEGLHLGQRQDLDLVGEQDVDVALD